MVANNFKNKVHGLGLKSDLRCAHYSTSLDIVAIQFKCCEKFYACIKCHDAHQKHKADRWIVEDRNKKAIQCGKCASLISIKAYLTGAFKCPCCKSQFNPRCKSHYAYYFDEGLIEEFTEQAL